MIPYYKTSAVGVERSIKGYTLIMYISGSTRGRVQVHLWTTLVDDEDESTYPNNRSISYTWGLPDDRYEILLDGCHLKVRRNLYEFLE
jgi:hypothetical protein